MSVSIRTALKNVASDKYDKGNVFIYLCFAFISLFISNLSNINQNYAKNLSVSIAVLILIFSLINAMLLTGFQIIVPHNDYFAKKSVFPNLFKDFIFIFFTGIKFSFGFFLLYLLYIIGMIPSFFILFFVEKKMFLLILFFVVCFVSLTFFIPFLQLSVSNFTLTLKFKDLFSFKKIMFYFKKFKKDVFKYISKIIILYFVAVIIYIALYFPISFVLSNVSVKIEIFKLIAATVSAMVFSFAGIYHFDLHSQFLKEIFPRKIVKKSRNATIPTMPTIG